MIILIAGATHTGKTAYAQRLLEKYKYPYLSIDHLKMGLIRSGQTPLTVYDDEQLTPYLWGIVKEIIKTAIENGQNLIVEGCYIPFDWQKDFDKSYQPEIKFRCLIMTENYIQSNFADIMGYENVIERRLESVSKDALIAENKRNASLCERYGLESIIIDKNYPLKGEI